MIRMFITLVLVAVLGPSVFAQTGAQRATIEQMLRGLSEEWTKVPLKHDTNVLKRVWAEDFVYVEPSGRVFNKQEGIADEAKSTDTVTSAEISDLTIRVYGGTMAVVVGVDRQAGRAKDGKAFDRRSRFTNVWVLLNGAWQRVSGHASDLPSK